MSHGHGFTYYDGKLMSHGAEPSKPRRVPETLRASLAHLLATWSADKVRQALDAMARAAKENSEP